MDSVYGQTGTIVSWQITFNEKYHTLSGMVASFGVKANDLSDIYRVLITYDDKYKKQWKSIDLTKNEITGVWEGQLILKGDIKYYIQAVDKAGNIGQLKEYGQDQNSNGQKYGSTWEYSKLFSITLLNSDSDTIPDAYEEAHFCLNKNLNDASLDNDYDYLNNLQEFEFDTVPCKGDSDGGGDNDGSEKNNGRNPLAYPDDKHLNIMVTKNGGNYTIDWNDTYGQNSLIDGYYFVYRSDTPFFDPQDKINPTPIPNGTTNYIDSNPPCSICFYNVWNYQLNTQPPIVEAVVPSTGPISGGTAVKVYGENFQQGAKVYFDNILAMEITFVNSSQINCKTPSHSAGQVNVKVVNPNGQEGLLNNGFTYY